MRPERELTALVPDLIVVTTRAARPEFFAQGRGRAADKSGAKQLSAREQVVRLADLIEEIRARDECARTRSLAPLVLEADAIEIDTSSLNPAQVFERIDELLKTRRFLR